MNEPTIVPVERLEFRLVDWQWPFAQDRRDEIAAHFEAQQRATPALWNGRIYMLRRYDVSNAVVCGEFFETGFAELLAWRDWGYPDDSIYSCFAMAAIESADKGFMLGVMGAHTANPGKVYFPTGTPDASDLYGDTVDLDRSVRRELAEETGLDFESFEAEPGWHLVCSGRHRPLIKRLCSRDTADIIGAQVRDYLAQDEQPEFSGIKFCYGREDLTPTVPPYVRAYLEEAWRRD